MLYRKPAPQHPELEPLEGTEYYVPVLRSKPTAQPAPPPVPTDKPDSFIAGFMLLAIALSGLAFVWVWSSSDRRQISHLREQLHETQSRAAAAESELTRIRTCINGGGQ